MKEEIKLERISFQIMSSSIRNSSVESLYFYVSTIYNPILFGNVEEGSKMNT